MLVLAGLAATGVEVACGQLGIDQVRIDVDVLEGGQRRMAHLAADADIARADPGVAQLADHDQVALRFDAAVFADFAEHRPFDDAVAT